MTISTQTIETSKASNMDLWNGEKYYKNSDQPKMVAELLISQYEFKNNDNVLDIGCGDGKITDIIASKVPQGRVIGLDPSESMINFARDKFKRSNVEFQIGLASELAFENLFDVITSFNCLHWEANQEKALLCFRRALKPNGTILLAIPGPDMLLRISLGTICGLQKWKEYFTNYQSPGHIWTTNEYANFLITTEFEIKKIERVCRTFVFSSESQYKAFVEAMLPHLSCLPKNQHPQFLQEVVEQVKRQGNIDEYGRMKFEVNVLEIIASFKQ